MNANMNMNDGTYKKFEAGDTLMAQGDMGDFAYIIEKGSVEILVQKGEHMVQIGTRGAGSLIGEMAMIDDQPRTATVRALETTSALKISRNDFARRIDSADPVLKMVTHVILTRYRDMLERARISDQAVPTTPQIEAQENENDSHHAALSTLKVHHELKDALKNNQFKLFYQPIIDIQNGTVAGFEALMRWFHPEKGMISPALFIPVAEDSGLIVEMSKWALAESCRAVKVLEQAIPESAKGKLPLFISVNFSVRDFTDGTFPNNVMETIANEGVQAANIRLEITESLFMEEPEHAKESLEKCRQHGVQVSIDDFGTGYSSLSYLHYFPIDTLKIDQSFIRSMLSNKGSFSLVKSIIALAKSLEMKVVAEGIEDIEEAAALKNLDTEMCQGFYFAKPMPLEEATAFLQSWEKPVL